LYRRIACSAPMEGEVVATGTQVCIIIIRLPDHRHPEHSPIEVECLRHVFYVQGQVSESPMLDHSNLLPVLAISIINNFDEGRSSYGNFL
jgi:hypothetical protein